jgi:hypothetical protein
MIMILHLFTIWLKNHCKITIVKWWFQFFWRIPGDGKMSILIFVVTIPRRGIVIQQIKKMWPKEVKCVLIWPNCVHYIYSIQWYDIHLLISCYVFILKQMLNALDPVKAVNHASGNHSLKHYKQSYTKLLSPNLVFSYIIWPHVVYMYIIFQLLEKRRLSLSSGKILNEPQKNN